METKTNYAITKNGSLINYKLTGLTKEDAVNRLLPVVEEFSSGYIYDNEAGTVYNEVSGQVYGKQGDEIIDAGDDRYEIVEETFDVFFHDDNSSNNKGFELSEEDAIHWVKTHNGSNESYFADYKGGVVQVVNNINGYVAHEEEVR